MVAVHSELFKFSNWVIPPLVSFLTLFVLAGISLLRGRGRKLNLLFAGICFLGGLLSIDKAIGSATTDAALALRVSRLDHLFVVFFIPLYLHFTFSFLEIRKRKWLLALAYAFSAYLSFSSQQDYYLVSVKEYYFGYYAIGGPLVYLFAAMSTLNALYCICLLFQNQRKEKDPVSKNKTRYILVGLGGAALMAHFDFLPVVGIGFYPLGNFAFIPLLVLGFGVLKHDLLDMELAFQKGLLYSVLTGMVTASYALLIIATDYLFKGFGRGWSLLCSLSFFVVIVFIFEPSKTKVQGVIDRLFQGKYDYHKTLRSLSQTMASMLNLKEIMDKTLRTLTHAMQLDWSYIMLMDELGNKFRVRSQMGTDLRVKTPTMTESSPLVDELARRRKEITCWDLERPTKRSNEFICLKKEFKMLGGAAVIPMIFKGRINGLIVLGNKRSGNLFRSEDFELLCTLANQCAVAVENAKAYELIENLNASLEATVEKRTASLTKALEEKEKTQDLLVRSESLASVGALVAGVAHELNNPLASVSSLVQCAVETLEGRDWPALPATEACDDTKEELVDDLRFSLKELNRARDIVASLLGISRQGQEYSEPVLINAVARDALRVLYNRYKYANIKIVEEYWDDLPEITGNFANLGQVCLNIITNAIQAVSEGPGKIVIRTRYDQANARVIFECRDSGHGIPEDIMKDIFKPFFTTKEAGKGTGLGLYISHEIVRRHNGRIVTKNHPRGGAVFQVELPASAKR